MLYKIMLFLHVTGVLLLCAAMALEWLGVINIRKADTTARIKETIFNYARLSKISGISMILILITGIYMMAVSWQGPKGIFAVFGFVGVILLGAIGGIMTGRKMSKIRKRIKDGKDILQESGLLQTDNSLWFSIWMRTTIFLGITFLMTVKPDLIGSIVTLGISIILGFIPVRMKAYSMNKEMQDIKS